ncbi:hypothetical protein BHM03_00057684 [Ensete ventricosum]|nr:hypothetical protein BHM03_00057684 [Ensete ventricosum]
MGFGGHWGANGEATDRRSTCTVGTGVSGRRHWAGFGWVGVGEAGGGGVIGHLPTLLWNEKHLDWAPWEVRGVQKKRMVLLIGGALNKEDGIGVGVTPVSRWSDTTHKGAASADLLWATRCNPRRCLPRCVARPRYTSLVSISFYVGLLLSLLLQPFSLIHYCKDLPQECTSLSLSLARARDMVGEEGGRSGRERIDKAGLAVGCRPERGRRKRRTGVALG